MSPDDVLDQDYDTREDVPEPPVLPDPAFVRMMYMRWIIRRVLLLTGIVAVIVVVTFFAFGEDVFRYVVETYWPVLLCPPLGWVLGIWAVRILYHPAGRLIFSLNPETNEIRVVFVPETMFPYYSQVGNSVAYHTRLGMPAYIARDIDEVHGKIDYGWVHDMDALIVFTRVESFNRWNRFTENLLKENIQLKDKPLAIGLAYAREFLSKHLDEIAIAMGLVKPDYSHHRTAEAPETEGEYDE